MDKPQGPLRDTSSGQPSAMNRSAWEDPDDAQLRVSIASNKRLRKLRLEESEDTITGHEYENRLRRQ